MRTIAILALLCAACTPSSAALTLNTAAINANTAALNRLTVDVERQQQVAASAARTPRAAGITCRDAKLTEYAVGDLRKGETPLGTLEPCPKPHEYAQCLAGHALSDVAAACSAGKLDELLAAEKKP